VIAVLMVLAQRPTPADTTRPQGRPCQVAIDSVGHYGRQTVGAVGDTNYFAGGGVLAHCNGTGTTFASDSVAWYSGQRRFDMIGRVKIRDTSLALDANLAYYYLREERLEAHNNVVAKNRGNGSTLRGPNLNYLRAAAGIRDTLEMFANQRPTIEYRGQADSSEPYVIVGDRVHFKGDDRMWAGGNVTVDRSDMAARADSMAMDQTTGLGVLIGKPKVQGKGDRAYTLVGTRIEMLQHDHELKQVEALGAGQAVGADWHLTADTIRLGLAQAKLQQAFAWGDSSRPRAVSTLQTIQSDSLALDVPDQVLTEARAYRRAFSTSKRDSTSGPAETDWIAGDTLVAHWVQAPDSAGHAKAQLQRLVSRGAARALTHHYDVKDPKQPPAIDYSRGKQIAITMTGDRIDRVLVSGQADGVHLTPQPPVDTTKKRPAADSARGAPAPRRKP
jgi:lipopolysaccharide export system protein LptA